MVVDVIAAIIVGGGIALVPGALGGAIIHSGWKRARHAVALLRSDELRVADVGHVDARVQLVGQATPSDEPVTSPLSGTECVLYTYEIEEYRRQGTDEWEWEEVDSGSEIAPFLLEDETGTILVDAEEYELWVGYGPKTKERNLGAAPADAIPGVEPADGSERRYAEGTVCPGDTVHVFGRTEPDGYAIDEGSTVRAAVRDRDGEPVHISDNRTWGATAKQLAMAVVGVVIGLPLVLFGILIAAGIIGSAAGIV